MLTIEDIKKTLKEEDLKVLKSLGQNFLIDEKALEDIIAASQLNPGDTAVEVGPGMGVLTFALSKRCKKVIAIEKDKRMSSFLRKEILKTFGENSNIEVISGDILKLNLPKLFQERGIGKYKVVANIPYYITSPITKLFLETEIQPEMIVVLMQKEVAERICAEKGDMSILALSVLLYGKPELVRIVGKDSFYPVPKVDSAILRISDISRKYSSEEYASIFKVIKIGFSAKRKRLSNNLAAGLEIGKDKAEDLLLQIGVDKNARAQDLEVEDWIRLKDAIYVG